MTKAEVMQRECMGQPIYRRYFKKQDGRSLWLYGYKPHDLPPSEELPAVEGHRSDLRFHPLRQEWAIYAAHRQTRTFQPSGSGEKASNPLAPHREGEPPTEIPFSDFEVAVFDNRFASLHPGAQDQQKSENGANSQIATGKCEVIVYSAEAEGSLATLGKARRLLLLEAWIDRFNALRAAGHQLILPFENRGADVGATLHHPHGQIYAFDILPNPQARAADAFKGGYDLGADMKAWGAPHFIGGRSSMTIVAPPFARFPYEAWIIPKRRVAGPWEFTDEECQDYADCLGELVARYDLLFGMPMPYMMALQAAPRGFEKSFHFTTQFYPMRRAADRLKFLASIEQTTGVFTVDVMPETAAAALRATNP